MKYVITFSLIYFTLNLTAQNNLFIGVNPVLYSTPISQKFENFREQSNIDTPNHPGVYNTPRISNTFSFALSVGYKRDFKRNFSASFVVDFMNYGIRYRTYSQNELLGFAPLYRLNLALQLEKRIPLSSSFFITPLVGFGYNKHLNDIVIGGSTNIGNSIGISVTGDTLFNEDYSYGYKYEMRSYSSYFYRLGISIGKIFSNKTTLELGLLFNRTINYPYNFESLKFYGEYFDQPYENSFRGDSSPYFNSSNLFLNIKYTVPIAKAIKNQ
jgi:hypothetical protein